MLEAEPASYSRHFLLLVRVFGNLTHNFVLRVFSQNGKESMLTVNFYLSQGNR